MPSPNFSQQEKPRASTASQDSMLAHVGSWAHTPSSKKSSNGHATPATKGKAAETHQPAERAVSQKRIGESYQISRWLQESEKEGSWTSIGLKTMTDKK
ncbi:hypothetical protein PG993_003842 [Apiospora rasikravindrae]|uniref:Uncharacterized protein n=1 Tax=Apiospora rasikravindrae TaxID=990691 RepID=A0ABR1U0P7_9PEZI